MEKLESMKQDMHNNRRNCKEMQAEFGFTCYVHDTPNISKHAVQKGYANSNI